MSASTIDADVQRLVDQAGEQGFPPTCSDPVVMSRITVALNGGAVPIKKTVSKRKTARASSSPAVKRMEGTAHATSA
jgi:hypothetical protein